MADSEFVVNEINPTLAAAFAESLINFRLDEFLIFGKDIKGLKIQSEIVQTLNKKPGALHTGLSQWNLLYR
jgi:hypothetical protein